MKLISLNGNVSGNDSFVSLSIEGGNNGDSIGDQVWISKDGKTMEVYKYSDSDVLQEAMNLFDGNSRRAFRGAILRMGVEI